MEQRPVRGPCHMSPGGHTHPSRLVSPSALQVVLRGREAREGFETLSSGRLLVVGRLVGGLLAVTTVRRPLELHRSGRGRSTLSAREGVGLSAGLGGGPGFSTPVSPCVHIPEGGVVFRV